MFIYLFIYYFIYLLIFVYLFIYIKSIRENGDHLKRVLLNQLYCTLYRCAHYINYSNLVRFVRDLI